MTKAAVDAGVAFAKIGLTAGGTGEQSALLDIFGKTVGADLSGPAREFAAAISHGGEAGGFAAHAGIFHHGTFDTTNVAQEYLKAIEYMRKLPREEALRMARAIPGLETAAPLLNVSDKQFEKMKGDASIQEQIFTPKFQQDTADFMSALARVGQAFENFVVVIIKPMLPAIVEGLNFVADGFNYVAQVIDTVKGPMYAFWQGVADAIKGLVSLDFGEMRKGIDEIWNAGKAKNTDPLVDALNRNARAVEDNTASYATRNGTYGGGERAHGAVPSKWSGMNTERYIGEARRLGAFAL